MLDRKIAKTLIMFSEKAIKNGAYPIDRVFGVTENKKIERDKIVYSAWKHELSDDGTGIKHVGDGNIYEFNSPKLFVEKVIHSNGMISEPTAIVYDDSFYEPFNVEVIKKRIKNKSKRNNKNEFKNSDSCVTISENENVKFYLNGKGELFVDVIYNGEIIKYMIFKQIVY